MSEILVRIDWFAEGRWRLGGLTPELKTSDEVK